MCEIKWEFEYPMAIHPIKLKRYDGFISIYVLAYLRMSCINYSHLFFQIRDDLVDERRKTNRNSNEINGQKVQNDEQ